MVSHYTIFACMLVKISLILLDLFWRLFSWKMSHYLQQRPLRLMLLSSEFSQELLTYFDCYLILLCFVPSHISLQTELALPFQGYFDNLRLRKLLLIFRITSSEPEKFIWNWTTPLAWGPSIHLFLLFDIWWPKMIVWSGATFILRWFFLLLWAIR